MLLYILSFINFCVEICFYLSSVYNTEDYILSILLKGHMFNFLRNCWTVFQSWVAYSLLFIHCLYFQYVLLFMKKEFYNTSVAQTAARQASLSITNSQSSLKLIHWLSDAIQPSHPLLSPSPPAFNLYQHQGLFQWVSSLHQVAKVLELQLHHQSFQWIFRTDFL